MHSWKISLKERGLATGGLLALLILLVLLGWSNVNRAVAQEGSESLAIAAFSSGGTINFQGQLADAGGVLIDGNHNMRFAIFGAVSGGTKTWPAGPYEEHLAVPLSDGFFSIQLGSVDPISAAAFNGPGDRYLQIWICTTADAGCTTYDDMGRLPISSTAYAQTLVLPAFLQRSDANSLLHIYNSGSGNAIRGDAESGAGIAGFGNATTGTNFGVGGQSNSSSGTGIFGLATATTGINTGVSGFSNSTNGVGVGGFANATTGTNFGVYGQSNSTNGAGVFAAANANTGTNFGIWAQTNSPEGYAGVFSGTVQVMGDFTATGTKSFKIDHPLDLENQYLYHHNLEGPEPFNLYRGTVALDDSGAAWVELPAYFEAINRDFTYQLTPVGAAMPNLHVAQTINDNRFQISGGAPGHSVSWQVTGIRNDAWVRDHGYETETPKAESERGDYLYPQGHGLPAEQGRSYVGLEVPEHQTMVEQVLIQVGQVQEHAEQVHDMLEKMQEYTEQIPEHVENE